MNQRGGPLSILPCKDGDIRVEALPDGRHRISVLPASGVVVEPGSWETAYPQSLSQTLRLSPASRRTLIVRQSGERPAV